jgi:hypothetical protein
MVSTRPVGTAGQSIPLITQKQAGCCAHDQVATACHCLLQPYLSNEGNVEKALRERGPVKVFRLLAAALFDKVRHGRLLRCSCSACTFLTTTS